MTTKHKKYPIDQSPLYKLQSKRKLAALFNVSLSDLQVLAARDDNYRIFTIGKGTPNARQVEEPKPHLGRIHRRLFTLLSRISTPPYLHSGVKGKSYITNAQAHIGNHALLKLDIRKFFPSTQKWHVFEYFHEVLQCSRDVAGLLAELSTVNGHVPTGSPLSQIIAFFAHYNMFEEIDALAKANGLTMTCYVDDIAISGPHVGKSLLYQIRGILKRRALTSHPKKERLYKKDAPREVTGSIVTGSGLLLPNRKHKQIHDHVADILSANDTPEKIKILETAIGKTIAATQSDPAMKRRLVTLTQEKKRVLKVMNTENHAEATDAP